MICRTRRPRTAGMRMFASRTIISAGCALPAPTQLLKPSHQLFFVNVRECLGKTVRCRPQFGNVGCLRALSAGGNVDTESFAAPGDGDGSIRLQEAGDAFAELAHADFDCGHKPCSSALVYAHVYAYASVLRLGWRVSSLSSQNQTF